MQSTKPHFFVIHDYFVGEMAEPRLADFDLVA
jgi:hypothetical protein